jgi:CheY-like chemotaxis protein
VTCIPAPVIPLNVARAPGHAGAAGGRMRSRLRRRSPMRRVLLVDDNQDHVLSLAALLQAMGHSVRTEYDGGAVLDAVAEFRPQVVILDIGLPVMDGYEVARRLRAAYPDRALLLVALTGYGQARDGLQAEAAGFDRFMVKPPDMRALSAILNSGRRTA